jgi:prepilin-type N-terminal cleavage/methylation domain-containing protein
MPLTVYTVSMRHRAYGFTIVELLIVIVVIAVLAVITIVAFNGVQKRSTNSSVISAASQTYKVIVSYISTNDAYPANSGGCIVLPPSSGNCSTGTPNNNGTYVTAINALATVGTLPKSVPKFDDNNNGILYGYSATRTFNGSAAPVIMYYYLQGNAENCGGIGRLTNNLSNAMTTSTNLYTSTNGTVTTCSVSIPGPAS